MMTKQQMFQYLIGKGLDHEKAQKIADKGYTLQTLSSLNNRESLNLCPNEIKSIFDKHREPIPHNVILDLYKKSKRVCCVCREPNKNIIIHHIERWEETRNNAEENLVILCLDHHAEAHSKKEISKNLDSKTIKELKKSWEQEVEKQDNKVFIDSYKKINPETKSLKDIKERWFNFFLKLKFPIDKAINASDTLIYDFTLNGIKRRYLKVIEIDDIEELCSNHDLIDERFDDTFYNDLIILGKKPFISNNGFYSDSTYIQLGWVYNDAARKWDNLMLKDGYDISGSSLIVENFINESNSYKEFLNENDFQKIIELWNY